MISLPEKFRAALNLQGNYIPAAETGITPDNTILFTQGYGGKTNAESARPIIGAAAHDPCGVMILYNPYGRKTGALQHEHMLGRKDLFGLLERLSPGKEDSIDVHIIGMTMLKREKENRANIDLLTDVLAEIEKNPRLKLKTFDVYTNPKPSVVAIDTRTGALVRGSRLYLPFEYVSLEEEDEMDADAVDYNFDGTRPELL